MSMKVKEIIQKVTQEEFIEIYDSSNTNIFSGMRKFINKDSTFLDKEVKKIWCEDYYRAIGIQIVEISNRKSDRELVKNLKLGMIKNAIGLSDIGFISYLNYLNITISMLYSFDLISKNEYDYLLKYISKVDWDLLCKKEV